MHMGPLLDMCIWKIRTVQHEIGGWDPSGPSYLPLNVVLQPPPAWNLSHFGARHSPQTKRPTVHPPTRCPLALQPPLRWPRAQCQYWIQKNGSPVSPHANLIWVVRVTSCIYIQCHLWLCWDRWGHMIPVIAPRSAPTLRRPPALPP